MAGGLLGVAAGAHVLPGAVAWRAARCRLLPRLSGVGRPGHVALTFDDGPDPASTPPILDALDALGWHATFFLLGSQVRRAPDLVRHLVDRGHELGVHGEDHRSHLLRSARDVTTDVGRARVLVEDLSRTRVRWMRPPYGGLAASTIVAARRHGLDLVLWTTWGQDWKPRASGPEVVDSCRRTFVPGATVLLHDSDVTSSPGSWRATLDALPALGAEWHRRGLEVGPLGEHF